MFEPEWHWHRFAACGRGCGQMITGRKEMQRAAGRKRKKKNQNDKLIIMHRMDGHHRLIVWHRTRKRKVLQQFMIWFPRFFIASAICLHTVQNTKPNRTQQLSSGSVHFPLRLLLFWLQLNLWLRNDKCFFDLLVASGTAERFYKSIIAIVIGNAIIGGNGYGYDCI